MAVPTVTWIDTIHLTDTEKGWRIDNITFDKIGNSKDLRTRLKSLHKVYHNRKAAFGAALFTGTERLEHHCKLLCLPIRKMYSILQVLLRLQPLNLTLSVSLNFSYCFNFMVWQN
jgi:hypothetical protein